MTKRVYIYTNIFSGDTSNSFKQHSCFNGTSNKNFKFCVKFLLDNFLPLTYFRYTMVYLYQLHLYTPALAKRLVQSHSQRFSTRVKLTTLHLTMEIFTVLFFFDEDPMVLWSSPVTKQKQQSHPKWAYICKTWICGVFFPPKFC